MPAGICYNCYRVLFQFYLYNEMHNYSSVGHVRSPICIKVAKVENTFVEAVSIYKRIMHIKTFKRKRKIIYLWLMHLN